MQGMIKYNFLFLVGMMPIFGMDKKQLVSRRKLPPTIQPKKLEQLPKITSTVDELDEDLECSLCFESYDRKKKKRIDLKCDKKRPKINHSFCEECLNKWSAKDNSSFHYSCPHCRRPVNKGCCALLFAFLKRLCSCGTSE